jgi:ABC-2 type transport system permease protein
MLLLIFSSVFSGGGDVSFPLYVQNLDQQEGNFTQLSQAFIQALNSTKVLEIKLVPSDVDGLEYVRENVKPFSGRPRLLIIPEGFQDNAINATVKNRISIIITTVSYFIQNYGQYMNESQLSQMREGMSYLNRFNRSMSASPVNLILYVDPSDRSGEVIYSILNNVATSFNYGLLGANPAIEVEKGTLLTKEWKAADYYLPGYISAFIMTNGIIGVLSITTDLKRRGIIKRFMVTPLRRYEWVLANILNQTVLAITLTILMMGIARLAFNVRALPGFFSWALIFLGALLFTGMGMFLAGLVKDVEAASALGNVIAFPMMFLSGAFWPLEIMPSYLQFVAKFLPLTYFSEGLRYTMIYQNPSLATMDFLVVGVLAIAFMLLGFFTTKWREE